MQSEQIFFILNRIIYSKPMIQGKFAAGFLAILSTVLALSSIIIIEQIAVAMGHQQPFPHAYISENAQHYPEFVVFRIATISGAVAMILASFINYFWLMQLSYLSAYNLGKYNPGISVILCTAGILFLFGSTATIDTGVMNNDWHTFCASTFFVLMIISQFYNTFVSWIMYSNNNNSTSWKMSRASMTIKVVMCGLYVFQLLIGTTTTFTIVEGKLVGISLFSMIESPQFSDTKAIVLEYTLAFSVLSYNFIMAYDVKNFQLTYRNKPASMSQEQQL